MAADPATAVLATVAADPTTAELAAVVTDPTTAMLAAVALEPRKASSATRDLTTSFIFLRGAGFLTVIENVDRGVACGSVVTLPGRPKVLATTATAVTEEPAEPAEHTRHRHGHAH